MLAIDGCLGVRLVDWVWIRFVNPAAQPAYPQIRAEAQAGRGRAG